MRNACGAFALCLSLICFSERRANAQASRDATAAFPGTAPSAPPPSGSSPPTAAPPPAYYPPPRASSAAPGYYPPPARAPAYNGQPPANSAAPPYYPPPSGYYAAPPRALPPPGYGPPIDAKKTAPVRSVSITMSPLLLVLPVAQVGVEVRPTNHLGLRVLGGIGSITHTSTLYAGTVDEQRVTGTYGVREVGVQVHAYPLAAFDSLVLGAEFLYIHVSGGIPGTTITGIGSGTALGPLIGYKLITSGGFTLLGSIGAGYVVSHGHASDSSSGQSASSDDRHWQLFANLDIGWSF